MKILVAEDEPNIAESYRLFLESIGHEVVLTSDGEQCVNVYVQEYEQAAKNRSDGTASTPPFDLIILDYRMPKKDGVQVAVQIRSIAPLQRILLASAFAHDLSVMDLSKNTATQSVEITQKPFEFDQLLSIVEKGRQISPADNHAKNSYHMQHDDHFSHRFSMTITWPWMLSENRTTDDRTNEYLNIATLENLFQS